MSCFVYDRMNEDDSNIVNPLQSTPGLLSDHVTGVCEETSDTDNVAKKLYLADNNKDTICSDMSATNQSTDSLQDVTSPGSKNGEEHDKPGGDNPLVIPQASKSLDILRSISNLENNLFLLHSLYKNKWSDKNLADDILTKQRIQKRVKSLNINRSAITNKTAYSPRKPKKKTTEREDSLQCSLPPLSPNRNLIKRCLSSPPGKLSNSQDEVGKSREKATNNKGGDNSFHFLPPLPHAKKEPPQRQKVLTPYPRQAIFGTMKKWNHENPDMDSDISENKLWRLQRLQMNPKQNDNYSNYEQKCEKFSVNFDSHRNETFSTNNLHKNNTCPKAESWTIPFQITKDDHRGEKNNVYKNTPVKLKASKIPFPTWKVPHSSKRKDPWEQRLETKERVLGYSPVVTKWREFCKQRIEQKYLQPLQHLQINKPSIGNQSVNPHYHPINKSRIPTRLPALNNKDFTTLKNRRDFVELTKRSKIPVLKPILKRKQTAKPVDDNTHLPVYPISDESPTVSNRSYSSISDTLSTNISLTDVDSPTTCPSSPVKCFHKDDVKKQMKLNLIKAVHKELMKNKQSEFKKENAWQIQEHREKIYGKDLNSPKDVLISTKFRQIYPQDGNHGRSDDENSSCPHVLNDCIISDNFEDVNTYM